MDLVFAVFCGLDATVSSNMFHLAFNMGFCPVKWAHRILNSDAGVLITIPTSIVTSDDP
jgi:hypothetical protein